MAGMEVFSLIFLSFVHVGIFFFNFNESGYGQTSDFLIWLNYFFLTNETQYFYTGKKSLTQDGNSIVGDEFKSGVTTGLLHSINCCSLTSRWGEL